MEVKGLFSSWAAPETSLPSAANFSERINCRCRVLLSSETARSAARSSILDVSSGVIRSISRGSSTVIAPRQRPEGERRGTKISSPFSQWGFGANSSTLRTGEYLASCAYFNKKELGPTRCPAEHKAAISDVFQRFTFSWISRHAVSVRPLWPPSSSRPSSSSKRIETLWKLLYREMASATSSQTGLG